MVLFNKSAMCFFEQLNLILFTSRILKGYVQKKCGLFSSCPCQWFSTPAPNAPHCFVGCGSLTPLFPTDFTETPARVPEKVLQNLLLLLRRKIHEGALGFEEWCKKKENYVAKVFFGEGGLSEAPQLAFNVVLSVRVKVCIDPQGCVWRQFRSSM